MTYLPSKQNIHAKVNLTRNFLLVLQRIVKDGENLSFGSLSGVINENETVVLLLDVAGGMRAKWRKKRMRRLRRKRRKMRQRAR